MWEMDGKVWIFPRNIDIRSIIGRKRQDGLFLTATFCLPEFGLLPHFALACQGPNSIEKNRTENHTENGTETQF